MAQLRKRLQPGPPSKYSSASPNPGFVEIPYTDPEPPVPETPVSRELLPRGTDKPRDIPKPPSEPIPSRGTDEPRDFPDEVETAPVSGGPFMPAEPEMAPATPSTPSDVMNAQPTSTLRQPPSIFGESEVGSSLFGKAGGLLEGGYGVPTTVGGQDDPSSLIRALLKILNQG